MDGPPISAPRSGGLAGIPDPIAVRIFLTGVLDRGAVIAGGAPAVMIRIDLQGIGRQRTVVVDIGNAVEVGVEVQSGTGRWDRLGLPRAGRSGGSFTAAIGSGDQVEENRPDRRNRRIADRGARGPSAEAGHPIRPGAGSAIPHRPVRLVHGSLGP